LWDEGDDGDLIQDAFAEALDMLQPPDAVYRRDPARWCDEKLNIQLWSKQCEIIESVRDNRETAVHSCHEAGKSMTAASTAVWWIATHPIGEAFVVTTAPTNTQVRAILWREMNRLHVRGELIGRMNLTEWYVGNELIALGRKPADYAEEAFQGIHARYVLVILDEACGVKKTLWDAGSTLTANEHSRILAIGNPDNAHGEFARVCRPGSGWRVIHIGAEHTPNFTGEPVSDLVSESLISPVWVEEKKLAWGEGSALFTSKIKGQFPTDADVGVIPFSWASACRFIELPAAGARCAGLDVGGGGDLTVLRERIGPRAGRERTWNESDPMKLVGQLAEVLNEWETERLIIDVIGLGWGVYGRLRELSRFHEPTMPDTLHAAVVIPFNAAEAPTQRNRVRFLNKRAEMHWNGRELARTQRWDLWEISDEVLQELTESHYDIIDSRGRIKIEPKMLVNARLGRSPDRADALLMAYWEGDLFEVHLPARTASLDDAIPRDAAVDEVALLESLLRERGVSS
jgi:hypothetical protein